MTSLACASLLFVFADTALERQREQFFDALTQWMPAGRSAAVLVVDIDRKSFQASPDRDWSRAQTARLIDALTVLKPKAIAFDFVFSTDCDDADADNRALAASLARVPSVLGFLIGETVEGRPFPAPSLALLRPVTVPDLWFIDGTETSCDIFQQQSISTAAAFLVGDEDAVVRRVQAYAVVGNAAYPALGVEAARLAAGAHTPILGGEPPRLRHGSRMIRLDEDGSLRFVASDSTEMGERTVSAADVVAGNVPADRVEGKVVLIGSSLPNLGGLRASASMPLEPSVQIHADLAGAILSDFLPLRDQSFIPYEAGFALIAGLVLAVAGVRLRPLDAAVVSVAVLVLTVGGAALIYARTALLIDAVGISVVLATVLLVTGLLQFAHIRRAEATARQRFGQYLPQSIVSRYIDNPDMERFAGEERQVTALFTDIEGFSTLSQKLPPQELVQLLDTYFAEVNALVARHGGMVDKVVGDAVHAFFNAPEDLADHVDKAIACALDIRSVTQEMCRRPRFAEQGFGRTRIGIETGMAVVGEVGAGGKLDYTAHGDAINLAARLQEANKFLGTAICVGPQAARETQRSLRPLGHHDIRGFGELELFTID